MALQTSASVGDPLLMSEARTEFGQAGTVFLSGYKIGSGNVANHENNYTSPAAIPTSGTIFLKNLLGSDKDFESNSWTKGSALNYSTTCFTSFTFSQNIRTYGYVGVGATYGTKGSIDVVGLSKSSTGQATTVEVKDYIDITNGVYYANNAYIYFTGDVRGTWFTSVTVNGTTKNRSAATTTSGTYTGSQTYWLWSSKWGLDGINNGTGFTFTVTL